ncbi:MAG: c-type cytochrome [Anaerolineales bacterium]|nr:c-type cytochrome [Anaerolineales bacterium]
MRRGFYISLFLLLFLSACNFSLAADVTPPPGYTAPPEDQSSAPAVSGVVFPLVPPDASKGAAIYVEKCAPCHGSAGMGDGPNAASLPNPVTALASPQVARAAAPASWFTIVSQGNLERFMPPFRSLSDRERWDVVAYAFSLSVSPAEVEQGAEIYAAQCAACHGDRGKGDGAQAAGMSVPDLTDQERMSVKSAADLFEVISNGSGAQMPAFSDKLSEDERWALTAFLRSLTFVSAGEQASAVASPTVAASRPTIETPVAPQPTSDVFPEASTITPTLALGSVGGLVADASGEPAQAGLMVNLHAFDQMQLVYTATATTNEEGAYLFSDLEMPAGRAFLTTLDYEGVIYGSDVAVAEEGAARLDLPITIYKSTSDTSALSVDRLHYFFEFVDEQTLRVLELYIISNSGDKTIIAPQEGEPVLRFTLPPGASNLQFESGQLGERYIQTADGFGDTLPIRPGAGNYQVLYSYELPYDRKLELSRPVALHTQAVVILVPEDGIKIKGDELEDAGTREIQGLQYHMYNRSAISPGGELRLTITGKPSDGSPTLALGSQSNLFIGIAAFGVTLILAGAWLFSRNRQIGVESSPAATAAEPPQNAESIMDAILALDDLYQEGKLPEEAYIQRRAELKQQLKDLMET